MIRFEEIVKMNSRYQINSYCKIVKKKLFVL